MVEGRYNASPPFQDLMWHLTAFWTLGSLLYFGIISAVVWTTTFGFAFGCVLGILFIFLTAWSLMSLVIVKYWGKKELKWWEECERAHGRVQARELGKEGRRESMGSEMTFGGKFSTVGSGLGPSSAVGSTLQRRGSRERQQAGENDTVKEPIERIEVTEPERAVVKDEVA